MGSDSNGGGRPRGPGEDWRDRVAAALPATVVVVLAAIGKIDLAIAALIIEALAASRR